MLRRTKGRLLLALLVITGLAGTVGDSTITTQERKQAVKDLKFTRDEIVATIDKLSPTQLEFRSAPGKWSVKECLYHITLGEQGIWTMLEESLKQPAGKLSETEKRMSDEQLKTGMVDRTIKREAADQLQPARATWTSAKKALSAFQALRAEHVKYVKNTTEDLRNHFVSMPFGKIDAYQVILVVNGHSARHFAQIREVMADPAFPK